MLSCSCKNTRGILEIGCPICSGAGIGIRATPRMSCPNGHVGSIPTRSTKFKAELLSCIRKDKKIKHQNNLLPFLLFFSILMVFAVIVL